MRTLYGTVIDDVRDGRLLVKFTTLFGDVVKFINPLEALQEALINGYVRAKHEFPWKFLVESVSLDLIWFEVTVSLKPYCHDSDIPRAVFIANSIETTNKLNRQLKMNR